MRSGRTRKIRVIGLFLALGLMVSASTSSASIEAAEPKETRSAFTKFTRGLINLATGWVEIPKRVHQTSLEDGAAAGFTWGLLRGMGYAFIRTAAGAYELVTFPFPAPPNYEPVIQPEFIFSEDASSYD